MSAQISILIIICLLCITFLYLSTLNKVKATICVSLITTINQCRQKHASFCHLVFDLINSDKLFINVFFDDIPMLSSWSLLVILFPMVLMNGSWIKFLTMPSIINLSNCWGNIRCGFMIIGFFWFHTNCQTKCHFLIELCISLLVRLIILWCTYIGTYYHFL